MSSSRLTSAQSFTEGLLVAGVVVGLLTGLGSVANVLFTVALDFPGPWALAIYPFVRLPLALAMLVGCILGLRRARRSRTWVRVGAIAFIVRELGHLVYGLVAMLALEPADLVSPLVFLPIMGIVKAIVTAGIAAVLFVQTNDPEVVDWLAGEPEPNRASPPPLRRATPPPPPRRGRPSRNERFRHHP